MASRAENRVVKLAGLLEGITLVTFPAASSIFTDSTEYDPSNTQYGIMAPVFVAVFVGLDFWWGMPVLSTVLLILLLIASARLPLRAETAVAADSGLERKGIPPRFWLFAGFAVLCGICEP